MSDNLLFHEFPPISSSEWKEKINADLKGADFEKKLVWKTEEGLKVQPYYRQEDLENLSVNTAPGAFPFVRGNEAEYNNWQIIQQINSPSLEEANKRAVQAVDRGAEGLSFGIDQVNNAEDLAFLLKNIDLTETYLHFHSANTYSILADLLRKEFARQNIDAEKVSGSFNFDSFGYYLLNGDFYNSHDDNMNELVCLLDLLKKDLPNFRLININGQHFANAGAHASQELAFSLASAVEYINQLTEKGCEVENILPRMRMSLSMGPSYFMEIAKFRAVRLLWANIAKQYTKNAELQKIRVRGVSSLYNKTVYDLYNNMLRNTTEAMSAAIGGVDEITVLPHDFVLGGDSEFGDRIARNVQLLLKEESHFDKVADPSAGSYYIENLTKMLAEKAWAEFLKIEEQGGFLKAMTDGFIKSEIENMRTQREKLISSRRKVYVGINNYPNLTEEFSTDQVYPQRKTAVGNALEMHRGAESFENLRYRCDAYAKAGNKRPVALMLQFGHPSMRNARAMFSSNFIGVGGYKIESLICENPAGVSKLMQEIKPDMVVLCSSDEEYLETGMQYLEAVKAVGGYKAILIAGSPSENEEKFRAAGIDDFIHMRSNALEMIQKFHQILSIQ
ncbi:MAG: methylmalonyl-CoA mutase small subunit [Bacteroidales bacterium]|nr:methylmalonyl-CoA mutase small subunit [Bacteroidales bacterium]